MLLWLLISAPLAYLVYVMIEPSYEAFSTLRIEPTKPELFGPSVRGMDATGFQPYLETQRNLILTDRVLDEALADQAVQNFPILRTSETTDPKFEVRKKLISAIIPGTSLIRVSYYSNDRFEAAAVVKAVVDAFIRQHRQFNLGDTDSLKTHYEGYVTEKRLELEKKKAQLLALAAKMDQAAREKPDSRTPPSRVDELTMTYLKEDINSLTSNIRQVEQKLEQLKFESQNTLVRVFLQDPAVTPKTPRANDRGLYMALVTIAILPVLLGLFFLFDALSRRRTGAD
jgi:uncharacterized protein involved in exopolysaccharide biosynthesis